MSAGKGDTPRAVNGEVFRRNYGAIFPSKTKHLSSEEFDHMLKTDPSNLADAAAWEADRLRSQLWRARDRAWKLARERSFWKLDCLEQCKLLAMGADREEKLLQEVAALKSQISNLKSP
jgi:hypothetical protein